MAIKAIINNTEKEIEQIKNSNEQDIDYVYSRIGDTEVEGEPPISIKSVGGNLADYRIYGQTVDGESVGDLVTSGEHTGEYKVPVTVEGKNLLSNAATSQEINGVTFTVNSDGSVTCNGTANNTVAFIIYRFPRFSGEYILSGCPMTGSPNTYRLQYTNARDMAYKEYGTGVNIYQFDETQYPTSAISIRIEKGYTCNNLTFYPMIRKADITDDTYEPYHAPVTTPIYLPEQIKKVGDEAEYISYSDQKLHRVGADDINVTLPALSTIKGTNTFLVNTSIQPSNMYIKDNFDYKKVFTATRTIEGESPLNYKNIEDNDSTLSNYRIYGNTVGGESVGDRTGNLFDGEIMIGGLADSTGSEVDGILTRLRTSWIKVEPSETYSFNLNNLDYKIRNIYVYNESKSLVYTSEISSNSATVTVSSLASYVRFVFRKNDGSETVTISDCREKFMLNSGSTPLPYEPYGYKVPVTVSNGTDTLTTPIYLPEQIRKVGEEAEYIDYGEQKQHFADGTSVDVTLPALPTLAGTNTLSVGTQVQPSKVYLKGKLKRTIYG